MLALALGAAGSGVYAASVLATPSSGLSTTILAQSQFSTFFAQGHGFPPAWGALMATYGQTDAYVVDNKIDPGGTTGWHEHPGPSLILVVSGQVTNYTSQDRNCAGHTYTAGQGFIDGAGNDEHTLRNNGTTEAEAIAVQLIPYGASEDRRAQPNPLSRLTIARPNPQERPRNACRQPEPLLRASPTHQPPAPTIAITQTFVSRPAKSAPEMRARTRDAEVAWAGGPLLR